MSPQELAVHFRDTHVRVACGPRWMRQAAAMSDAEARKVRRENIERWLQLEV